MFFHSKYLVCLSSFSVMHPCIFTHSVFLQKSIVIFFRWRQCQGVAIPVKSLPAPQKYDINKEIFEFNASCAINKLSWKWNVCYWNWNVRTLIAVLTSGQFEGKLVAGKGVGVTENWKPKIVLMLNLRWWWWEVEHIKGWVTGGKKKLYR